MELYLQNTQVAAPNSIANFEELKAQLEQQLQKYKNMAITQDNIAAAKSDRANLNKLKTAVDDQRKAVKKQWAAYYAPFEEQCKILTAMIDEPIRMIDAQLHSMDEEAKQKKYAELQAHFDAVCDLNFLTLGRIVNPKWQNATCKVEKLKEEITETIGRVKGDYSDIMQLFGNGQFITPVLNCYVETLDKSKAIAYGVTLTQKEQERQKQAEKVQPQPTPQPEPIQPETIGSVSFRVTGTKSQIIKIRDFMKSNNISFEVIK